LTQPRSPEPTTAALRALEALSYPEAVLWLAARLADGLAYAHDRGIVHRDLKPANILLKDDGEPMLLDFNLSDNASLRGTEAGARVGGTLPYMSPEQLRAFQRQPGQTVDARSDLYSLGLILFELLSGRMAFASSASGPRTSRDAGRLAQMIADRAAGPPPLRAANPAVTPAVHAIVRKCLDPDPARRYQTAAALKDDIERHLNHLPLKHAPEPSLRERFAKWRRRHPRLTSGTAVAAAAAVLLAAGAAAAAGVYHEVQNRRAADQLRLFDATTEAALPRLVIRSVDAEAREAAAGAAWHAVADYGVFDRPDSPAGPLVSHLSPADQDRLRGRVGEVLFLL